MAELAEMRENMERMEEERAEMMAEVEAQIERALASMAVDIDVDSEYSDYSRHSRPSSRTSSRASHTFPKSRRGSDAQKARLPSIGTESTLAESYQEHDIQGERNISGIGPRETGTIEEEDEEPVSPAKKKRFSATVEEESHQDTMKAMDEDISSKSDKIAQKVLQIQQKVIHSGLQSHIPLTIYVQLDAALGSDSNANVEAWKNQIEYQESDADATEKRPLRSRLPKGIKLASDPPKARKRSGTGSTTKSGYSSPSHQSTELATSLPPSPQHIPAVIPTIPSEPGNRTPTGGSEDETPSKRLSSIVTSNGVGSASPVSPITPGPQIGVNTSTDDSDTDFQSAYSRNSRGSTDSLGSPSRRWSSDGEEESNVSSNLLVPPQSIDSLHQHHAPEFPNKIRQRLSSTATAVLPSPTMSTATVAGRNRKREATENTM